MGCVPSIVRRVRGRLGGWLISTRNPARTTGPTEIPAIRWDEPPEGPVLVLLDQTRLPAEEVELVCTDVPALVEAIRSLAVRGAPLLGIAGAYGVALAAVRGLRRGGGGRRAGAGPAHRGEPRGTGCAGRLRRYRAALAKGR